MDGEEFLFSSVLCVFFLLLFSSLLYVRFTYVGMACFFSFPVSDADDTVCVVVKENIFDSRRSGLTAGDALNIHHHNKIEWESR
jgi:hypothetical protein